MRGWNGSGWPNSSRAGRAPSAANASELFDLARRRAGNWPGARTVAVGDTPLDVSSAHAAGCHSIAVTTGSYGREALADADAVIADLGELAGALAAL
ncbi:MAG: hypothetical protein E6G18_09835 [Actinobacteria bacterium]|nr:MAG: hypothetical protein E6G18_09835 [Actinomycetota bacterium]